jgi:hypothetical protein
MAEDIPQRRLPQIARDNPRRLNESLEETVKDSISRLQSSIRQGLALNRAEIKASTSAILAVQATLAQAFNVNQDLIEIEKEKMRIAEENRREADRKSKQKDKKDKGFIAKAKGGLFDVLKKVFFGGALVGAVMLVVDNWDIIVDTFEKIKPTLIAFKDKVVEVAKVALPFLIDNFDTIAKFLLGAFIFSKIPGAMSLLRKGLVLFGSGMKMVAVELGKVALQLIGAVGSGAIKFAKLLAGGMKIIAIELASSAKELLKTGATKLAQLARAVVLATTIYAKTTLLPALASLKAGLIAAAPFVAIAAGIALIIGSLVNAIGDAKDKFEETGSVTEALKEGLKSLFANIIGLPIKLIQKVGQMIGLIDDPVGQAESELEEAKASLSKTAKALEARQDESVAKVRESEANLKDAQEGGDPVSKIKGFLDSLDPEAFMKNLLRSVLPDPNGESIIQKALNSVIPDALYEYAGLNPETGEAIQEGSVPTEAIKPKTITEAVQPVDEFSGAEIDVRSREVGAAQSAPTVNVAAPQTTVQSSSTTNQNSTTVAPASPQRSRQSPQARDTMAFIGA